MLKACQADSRRRHNQMAASERHGPQLEGRRYRSRRHWSAEKCAPRRRCSPVERVPEDREQNKGQAMEIERTTFGTITIDGKTYEHDVIIRLSGEVVYCSPPLR